MHIRKPWHRRSSFECTELHNKHGTGIHIQHIITRKRVGSREIARAERPAVRRPFGTPANERPHARALAHKSQSLISGQPHEMHTHRKVFAVAFAEHAARCTREVELSETLTYRVLAPNVAAERWSRVQPKTLYANCVEDEETRMHK